MSDGSLPSVSCVAHYSFVRSFVSASWYRTCTRRGARASTNRRPLPGASSRDTVPTAVWCRTTRSAFRAGPKTTASSSSSQHRREAAPRARHIRRPVHRRTASVPPLGRWTACLCRGRAAYRSRLNQPGHHDVALHQRILPASGSRRPHRTRRLRRTLAPAVRDRRGRRWGVHHHRHSAYHRPTDQPSPA